ncbi:S8 family peptidase [Myceligenerans pegani]|uniref:S8 family serine peptidase n=1 Tax=Myceligenerans pegani TaxID=2776917 RepID=A0ABR9MY46_9MICO|nr:S8 family serine peptidase [Myceligenerans sp. TRM 65318]MBE1876289.1 S8 family serine peptidase [Myceligenerans sp. TRM 65318]MBE3018560.1 S8 family serine peptidase [Myceligenerans sp. TRM 65318]
MRRISLRVTAAVAALVVGAIPAAVAAPDRAPAPPGGATGGDGVAAPAAATGRVVVTLLTGDRVSFLPDEDHPAGGSVVRIDAAPRPGGEPVSFRRTAADGTTLVVPSDVATLVPARLDPSLFDVVALAAVQDPDGPGTGTGRGQTGADQAGGGQGAAPGTAIPVIVRGGANLPGAPAARVLESIGATAGSLAPAHGSKGTPSPTSGTSASDTAAPDTSASRTSASDTASGGAASDAVTSGSATDTAPRGPASGATTPGGPPSDTTASGTRSLLKALADPARERRSAPRTAPKVWLDMPVEAADADSAPQVGAPQAWDAGYTGEGVTVAVLDSGIDTTHPDLAGAVVGERDFTDDPDGPDPTDGHGHGTHVASILAGSGAASDGAHRGIAPDADLLNAKVLDDNGDGLVSWSIDALEWAGTQDADIANMSLGQPWYYTDGTDPASLAVDAATERYDMLVVAAAGNDGPGRHTITPPGTATSALTVAAVDDADEQAWFSSAGPRFGDHALKPDIAAPGDGIVAARAAGTSLGDPVDDLHTALSGTSMATPHVAGAAAILAQQRPDLSARLLKSVLMTAAEDTPPNTWQEGAGRLWIPGALEQPVTVEPASLSLGLLTWPQRPETRTLTYTNPGAADTTLDLSATLRSDDGGDVPGGLLTLSAERLTVPAGGSATVDVTIDAGLTAGGLFGGEVTATDADGRSLRTVVGLSDEPESYRLRVEATGRDGAPAGADDWVTIMRLENSDDFFEFPAFPDDGVLEYRVPVGTYYVGGFVTDTAGTGPGSVTAVSAPEIAVDRDVTVTLDARDAVPVEVRTHRPAERESAGLTLAREVAGGSWAQDGSSVTAGQDLYALPTDHVDQGEFRLLTESHLRAPDDSPSYRYDMMHVHDGAVPDDLTEFAGRRTTATVRLDHRASHEGQRVESFTYAGVRNTGRWETSWTVDAPATVTQYLSTDPAVSWTHGVSPASWEHGRAPQLLSADRRYEPGERARETLLAQVHHAGFYVDPANDDATSVHRRADGFLSASLPPWVDDAGHSTQDPLDEFTTNRVRLWRDGELLDEGEFYPAVFAEVPDAEAGYRLRLDLTRDAEWWPLSTEVHADWRFRSGAVEETTALPLLQLDYGARLDAHNRGEETEVLRVSVGHQERSDGGRVQGLRLWWSADDGDTWRRAPVRERGEGRFDVRVTVPDGTEHVSLRAKAWDDAGSRLEETVIRAYAVE